MYITYAEYSALGGNLDEPTFNAILPEAESELDYHTFKRLCNDTEFSDKVKQCLVKLIQTINSYNTYIDRVTDMDNAITTSQSNDGVSVSYGGYLGNTSPNDVANISRQHSKDMINIIQKWLYGERNQSDEVLLYRGVYK